MSHKRISTGDFLFKAATSTFALILALLVIFIGVVLIRLYRSGVMLALAFGASAPRLSERWNRA